MNLPIHTDTAMMPYQLPDDPDPGQVFTLPEGHIIGGSTVINIYLAGSLVGSIASIIPITNVTRMYRAERAMSSSKLPRNTLIRVKALQFSFTEVTFFQNFGWIGTRTTDAIIVSDKYYRILASIPVGPTDEHTYLYEQLCLCVVEAKKD